MNIGFFVRHFSERGTENAIYNYAHYNETILGNKSYIICFNEHIQPERFSYYMFENRFQIIEINVIEDMTEVIKQFNLQFFYTLTHGGGRDFYKFQNKIIWGNCKTIKHCVFFTDYPESDYYISISEYLNIKNNTNLPVIPHIVDLPDCSSDLRKELKIPSDSIVFGRYGGYDQFNIDYVKQAIIEHINSTENVYFLFMNTMPFFNHNRIIYLDKNIDSEYKVKFINTCDFMIHARKMGETFGLSIAEFSIKNKPVITCDCGDREHIKILGDKSFIYSSKESLLFLLKHIPLIKNEKDDWNCYREYSPENIMKLFDKIYKNENT